ncbi:unnamed protein product [Macrosiphum euphorbiae]|uniref:Uncharacterized protein n=1 Tax=Macrosiphum euphorbiae TaxID=13131 RepID=A0AAV0XBS1_9HEMI|nr:unnamed protein product [Macrosiphum euphorbiae]
MAIAESLKQIKSPGGARTKDNMVKWGFNGEGETCDCVENDRPMNTFCHESSTMNQRRSDFDKQKSSRSGYLLAATKHIERYRKM